MTASHPALKVLLSLAWPVIIARSTQVVVNMTDAVMVAHLGENALAATTTGGLNAYAGFIFPMGITFVISSFSAQLFGRLDVGGARRFGWYGLGLGLISQIVMLISLPALPWLISGFDYSPPVRTLMESYLTIRLLSTGAAVGIEALGNYYGGIGNTRIGMRVNISAMLLNILLNWLLIDGHGGFPALGVAGSAWASVIATSLACGVFVAIFLWQGRYHGWPLLRWDELGRLLRFGIPAGLNWSFEFFAFIAFINVVVASLGTVSLAAMMAVMQLNSFSFMPAFGLGSAGAILIGHAIGGRRQAEVPGILLLTFLVTAAWMGLVGLAYVLMPELLLHPFVPAGTQGSKFLVIGKHMLVFSALWQLFDAAGITLSEALRAAGDTTFSMWVRGILAWLVFLPGSWISVHYFGGAERSAVAWLLVYLGALAGVFYWRFQSCAWRHIELVAGAPIH